ncbi:phage holin family protein [Tumebacillus lipolyticus]|uniref:Phage holin family protein n=1 Tax=Tumebacillus lipolyticus TaxID=1280370 RepID=A0ABW4ZXV5_9BACL
MLKTLSFGNLLTTDKGIIAAAGGAVGAVVDVLYGPERFYLVILFWAMIAFDWIAGIRAAKKDKTYASAYGIDGAFRTLVVMALPALGNLIDHAFGSPGVVFYGLIIALSYHTWQSFTANSIRAGWERWIPTWALGLVESELKAKMARAAQRQQPDLPGEAERMPEQADRKEKEQ